MKKFVFLFFSSFLCALDYYIPPEVLHDSFYAKILEIAAKEDVKTILEIGSSSGEGSTAAFVEGMSKNPNKPLLFCMEVSKLRFDNLSNCYKNNPQVVAYNVSSVPLIDFPSKENIISFMRHYKSNLRGYGENTVLGWLDRDFQYISYSGVEQHGIELIKRENNIQFFDAVLIDGCEFTGKAEFNKIYGAKYILLDDVCSFKNYFNYRALIKDANYEFFGGDLKLRNGWAAFKKVQ
jgi:hypothetical protein